MIDLKQYKEQALKENPNMTDKNIYTSYLMEKELEQFDNVSKPKFKPWGKTKLYKLISKGII